MYNTVTVYATAKVEGCFSSYIFVKYTNFQLFLFQVLGKRINSKIKSGLSVLSVTKLRQLPFLHGNRIALKSAGALKSGSPFLSKNCKHGISSYPQADYVTHVTRFCAPQGPSRFFLMLRGGSIILKFCKR